MTDTLDMNYTICEKLDNKNFILILIIEWLSTIVLFFLKKTNALLIIFKKSYKAANKTNI